MTGSRMRLYIGTYARITTEQMDMILKIDREGDARAIAAALEALYPSYRYEANRWPRARKWSLAVYCRATGALLQTRAEV